MSINFFKNGSIAIVTWLIAMLVIAPFTHAHPNGFGATTGAGLHLHLSDDIDIDTFSATGSQDTQPTIHAEVIHQHIVAVASGIMKKLKLDPITTLVLLVVAWVMFSRLQTKHYLPLASRHFKRHHSRTRSPRAPPALT